MRSGWLLSVRNELEAGEPVLTDEITGQVMTRKGFNAGDPALRTAIRDQVGSVLKGLHQRGLAEPISRGRGAQWKLTI